MVLPKALDERCSLTKATSITRKISNLEKCDSLAPAEKENEMKHYLCDGVKYENCFKPLFGLLLSAFAAFAMAVDFNQSSNRSFHERTFGLLGQYFHYNIYK